MKDWENAKIDCESDFGNKNRFYNKCWGLEEIEISTFIFFEKKKHICMKSSKIK